MLAPDRLRLAIDVQARSYQLLRWVADAVRKGFIPATRAHQYADTRDAAFAWMREHYRNLPTDLRPDRRNLREFASFFGTYVTSSFEFVEQPGFRLDSRCGCYCPLCARLVHASHLRTRKLRKRDKERAKELMFNRVSELAREEAIGTSEATVLTLLHDDETRRSAAYSAYGYWLIRRLDGDTDGPAVLALWREIAWKRTGSPIPKFRLAFEDFERAEELLVRVLRQPT